VLHESNSVLGLANALCRPLASALAAGLPLEGAALTGTPIREELWKPGQSRPARERLGLDADRATLLVFGGSQGARAINAAMPQALARTPGLLQVLHLAGAADADAVRRAYAQAGVRAVVLPYLKEMDLAYAAADLVLCRSGASTLAELAAQSKPALLIPYPAAAAGHQEANARVLESAGAAEVMLQRDMTPESLAARLSALADPGRLARMRQAYARLAFPSPQDSVERLAGLVTRTAKR
jgi:UDP-N-acetylglucosamine--N-acetylmuramyl-(pentapeptide) pyrophosphoryl-undecaprenol N-acetylglucosamine transferase